MAFAGPVLSPTAVANDVWLSRFRTTLVAVLGGTVMGIACLAFYTSFEAIRSYAVRSQGIAPEHGWAVPLLVDSFIVVATGADLWFTTTKARRAWWEVWWPKLLLAFAAGVSFVLNVAHAEPTWAARGVAAIPPAALVLGVELLMMVLRRATTIRAARLQAEMEAEQAAAMEAPVQRARIQIEAMRRPRRADDELGGSGARAAGAEPRAGALPRPAAQPAPPARPPAAPRPPDREATRPAERRIPGPAEREATRLADREPAAAKAPIDTFRDAVAAARGQDAVRPRRTRIAASVRTDAAPARGAAAGGQTPYMVAASILDERADGDTLSAEGLREALAGRGVDVSPTTAQALLRELRPPLSSRLSAARRPGRPRGGGAGNGDRPGAG